MMRIVKDNKGDKQMLKEKNTYTVEQEMIADNDTLIITDPCYIMRDEHWEHFLNLEFSSQPIGLDNYLRKYHSFGELLAGDTGIGDWNNEVVNSMTGDVLGEFAADAGMVIVCTASDLTNYGYDKDEVQRLKENGCLTIIEDFTGHIQLEYHYDEYGNKLAVIKGASNDSDEVEFYFETKDWD